MDYLFLPPPQSEPDAVSVLLRCHGDATPLLHPLISVPLHRERAPPPSGRLLRGPGWMGFCEIGNDVERSRPAHPAAVAGTAAAGAPAAEAVPRPTGQKKNLLGRVVGPSEAKVWPGIFSHMTFRGADLLSCPCRHGMFAELISLLVSQA